MKRLWIAAVLLAWSGTAAWSCGKGKLLFEEKFAQRPAYIPEAGDIKYADSAFIFTVTNQPNKIWLNSNNVSYQNYEVCATVSAAVDKVQNNSPHAGVVFFVFGNEHYMQASVSNIHGSFTVNANTNKTWTTFIPWQTDAAINKGPTAENEISVSTRDNFAMIRINGKPVAQVSFPVRTDNNGNTFAGFSRNTNEDATTQIFRVRNYQIREAVWK